MAQDLNLEAGMPIYPIKQRSISWLSSGAAGLKNIHEHVISFFCFGIVRLPLYQIW
jgi:hypothetical protein